MSGLEAQNELRVGAVAKLAHVTVRALHHYDRIGLLRPSGRSEAGHRLYTGQDLERLQTVLLYRELGFALGEIRDLLAEPGFDRREALRAQRAQLARRSVRLEAMLTLIDKTLAAMDEGMPMERDDMFGIFGDFDPAEHEAEAEARWGGTDAYKESARRTRRYTKDDWKRFKAESDTVNEAVAGLMDEGVAADDPRAMDAVEQQRLLIDAWFYPCPHEMHAQLGRMYVEDPRFAATYEKVRPGMAKYVCNAIAANSARRQAAADRRAAGRAAAHVARDGGRVLLA
jgi:MerR family transcriptional regulator, thiopeptide resistance regulator